jgi:glycosyltransferase involved in cell wall biosynthesis
VPGVQLDLVPVRRRSIHHCGAPAVVEFLWRAARVLRGPGAPQYDLAHFHFSVPTGLLAPLTRGRPYVCSLHGIDVPGYVAEASLLQRAMLPFNRRILAGAARVVVPSHDILRVLTRACPETRVEVVQHGVWPERVAVRTAYPSHARNFVTIARLAHWKRIDLLVEAVIGLRRNIPDVTLDVFGEGDQRARLEQLVEEAEARSFVRLRGMRPHQELLSSLNTYDAFVLPSISEAFGLVVLEAMAAGLPVVGVNAGGPAEIIRHEHDGLLIEGGSGGALGAAMTRLATEAGLAERLGRNARARVIEHFTWQQVAQRYLAIYRDILSGDADSRSAGEFRPVVLSRLTHGPEREEGHGRN